MSCHFTYLPWNESPEVTHSTMGVTSSSFLQGLEPSMAKAPQIHHPYSDLSSRVS